MDSLRYWVLDMHVDGFRFDLASTLAREFYDVDRLSAFFDLVQQDPVISQVKLIAEPWDVGGVAIGSAISRVCGANGMGNTATLCATTGGGEPATLGVIRIPTHRVLGPVRGDAALAPASTSSPATTVSP